MASVISIDMGSSSVRVLGFDSDCAIVPSVQGRRSVRMDPATNTFDAEEYLLATEEAMEEALRGCAEAGVDSTGTPEEGGIKAVAISCFAMSLVQVDPAGRALSPVYTYASTASAGAALRLREQLRQQGVLERVETLNPKPYFLIPKP